MIFFNKQSNNDNLTLTTTIVNNGKIRIKLPDNITTSDLGFDNLTHSYEEAFNMYTLNSLELYDDSKVYEIVHNIEDEKTFTLTVKEVV